MSEYIRKYKTSSELLVRIGKAMKHIERLDFRIDIIYLNPNCVKLIEKCPEVDRIGDFYVREYFPGLVAHLYGMRLFESTIVPEEHVAFIIDGIEGKLVGPQACFGL